MAQVRVRMHITTTPHPGMVLTPSAVAAAAKEFVARHPGMELGICNAAGAEIYLPMNLLPEHELVLELQDLYHRAQRESEREASCYLPE